MKNTGDKSQKGVATAITLLILLGILAVGEEFYIAKNKYFAKKAGTPLITLTLTPTASPTPSLSPSPMPAAIGSGVTGTVMLGPTCPVQRVGDETCNDKPYPSVIEIYKDGDQNAYATSSTDRQAYFKIELEPGDYTIKPATGGSIFPRCESQEITVEKHRFQNLLLFCDTGIR